MTQLLDYARTELNRAGLLDAASDYNGEAGKAVLELVEKFSEQGHSRLSMELVLDVFGKVARFQPLTPITASPDEWMNVSEYGKPEGAEGIWQSRRNPSLFSNDGGKTYYDLDEPGRPLHEAAEAQP